MKKNFASQNESVNKFLADIGSFDDEKLKILQRLRKILFKHFPSVREEIKYGGICFLLDDHLFGGFFVRKNHLSLEFVHGSTMNDPDGHLEGKGKFRRHIKLRCLADITGKDVDFFIAQALAEK